MLVLLSLWKCCYIFGLVFLQDPADFESRFPPHPLLLHSLYSVSMYGGFTEGVSANLNGKEMGRNILIYRASRHLGHGVVYLNVTITFLVTSGLKNSTHCSVRLKSD